MTDEENCGRTLSVGIRENLAEPLGFPDGQ